MYLLAVFAAEPRAQKLTIHQDRHKPDLSFYSKKGGAWSMVADKEKQIREIAELELKFIEEDYTLV